MYCLRVGMLMKFVYGVAGMVIMIGSIVLDLV
jgi:hypothetical protein